MIKPFTRAAAKMAGRSVIIQWTLLTLCLISMLASAEVEDVHVISVPLSNQQIQEFLNKERLQLKNEKQNMVSTDLQSNTEEAGADNLDTYSEHFSSEVTQTLSPYSNFDSTASGLEANTELNIEGREDEWLVKMSPEAKITHYFLNHERKYMDDVGGEFVPESSTLDSKEETANEVEFDNKKSEREANSNELEGRFQSYYEPKEDLQVSVALDSNHIHSPNMAICGTVNLNKLVDQVIGDLRQEILDRKLDKIKIPDIHESFTRKVGIISVKGDFIAQNGLVKNLSTIERTADVIASSEGNSITIACGFGLSHLEFDYDRYKATFMDFGPKGKINVAIAKDSLLLNATVSWKNQTCTTVLNELRLDQLSGLSVKITGLGPLNFLVTKISNWAFQTYNTQIKEKIEDTLRDILEKQLKTFDCTKYILKWALAP